MMNLIKIRNLTNSRTRLYRIPAECAVAKATLCRVPFGSSTALGIAVCDSWMVDEAGMDVVRKITGIPADVEIKAVIATYTEQTLEYPEDAPEVDEFPDGIPGEDEAMWDVVQQ